MKFEIKFSGRVTNDFEDDIAVMLSGPRTMFIVANLVVAKQLVINLLL